MSVSVVKRVNFHASLRGFEIRIPQKSQVQTEPAKDSVVATSNVVPEESSSKLPEQSAELLESLSSQLDALSADRSQRLAEMHEITVELALIIASHVVKQQLDADQVNLNELVGLAIEELLPADNIHVRMHPQDASSFNAAATAEDTQVLHAIEVTEDPALPRGACYISNDEHGLYSSLETRLDGIRETLLQGIEYARTERRQTVGIGKSLRRFPDRRKLA